MALQACLCISLVALTLILIFLVLNMSSFSVDHFDTQWHGNGNYSEQNDVKYPKYYIGRGNGGFLMDPGNYTRMPWTRKSFYRYPFFNRRYVSRLLLDQAL